MPISGLLIVLAAAVMLTAASMFLSSATIKGMGGIETIPLPGGGVQTVEFNNDMEWISGSWIGDHWWPFNGLAMMTATLFGLAALASPLSRGLYTDDISMWILLLITATVFGFHFIWSSCMDWRFHKVPRMPILFAMFGQLIATIACTATSHYFKMYLLSSIILTVFAWLTGLVPKSGPSDGRMLAMIMAGATPFMSTQIIWPFLIFCAALVVHGVALTVMKDRTMASNTDVPLIKRVLKSSSPLGPYLMVVFPIWLLLTIYGIVPSNSINLVV